MNGPELSRLDRNGLNHRGACQLDPVRWIRLRLLPMAKKSVRQFAWVQDTVWLVVGFSEKNLQRKSDPRKKSDGSGSAWNVNFDNGNVNNNDIDNTNYCRCVR